MNAGHDTGSNDSVERANALALGMTPQSAARSKAGGYEPERREARLKQNGGPTAYQRGSNSMNTDNQVLQQSPAKKSRVGLPPTNRAGGMGRARQSESRFEP